MALTTGLHLLARLRGISSTSVTLNGMPGRFSEIVDRICARLCSSKPFLGTSFNSIE